MTTVVHTADVHLQTDTQPRLDALEAVLQRAEAADADVLTIGGDLFDRPADVDNMRTELRNRYFSDRPFEILLIPGNHDIEAFRDDLFFGDSCTVVADEEYYGTWTGPDGDFQIVAIPYRPRLTDDLLFTLHERPTFEGTEVLLFHGSLDAPIGTEMGEESDLRYFPVSKATLMELGFDYYLAGHYHQPHLLQFETGAAFAYPGTPASTRSSETGQRQVVRLDDDDGLSFESLETFHHLETQTTVTPGNENAVIEELTEWVASAVSSTTEPSIVVDGVVGTDESDFAERLHELADPEWVTNETVSAAHVRDHPVVREFESRLAEEEWDEETKAAVWTRMLRVASRAISSRRST